MQVVVPLQRFLAIQTAVLVAVDVLLWRRAAAGRLITDADRELRDRVLAARLEPWSTHAMESSSLRVETVLEQAVQYNRDGDELDASTYGFVVSDVDGSVRIASPDRSIASVRELVVTLDASDEAAAMRDAVVRHTAAEVTPPHWCLHPALPPAWLERARALGLATPAMEIDWTNVNAVGLLHRERTGRFVVRYAADRVACCVVGPRPEPGAAVHRAHLELAHVPDLDALTGAITQVLWGDLPAEPDAAGEWSCDAQATAPQTMSIEHFERPTLTTESRWRRLRIGAGWFVESVTGSDRTPHRLQEFGWFDEDHRFHGIVRLIASGGRCTVTAHFTGERSAPAAAAVAERLTPSASPP